MKTLFKLRILQSVWTPQSPSRLFHKDNRRLVSQIVSHYESINRCEQELPEHFNFASDVLDKWSQLEKVAVLLHHRYWARSSGGVNQL
uniref:Uncharacterized protein n=1 Tax=Gopherus agassizii TaxID=38772 RepID=A0A452GQP3_9SAUR